MESNARSVLSILSRRLFARAFQRGAVSARDFLVASNTLVRVSDVACFVLLAAISPAAVSGRKAL
jgi:hypothetical protein